MLGLPEAVKDYDYGLKTAIDHMNDEVPQKDIVIKKEVQGDIGEPERPPLSEIVPTVAFPPDAFLMVTQVSVLKNRKVTF